MKREATDARVPLLRTSHLSSAFIDHVEQFLQEALTASTSVHGVLIDVIGVGVLILGKSGIGKSELALDLVTRGHRLVADDIVDLKRRQGGPSTGAGREIIKHHMEIRGIGIINIKDLFGVSAVRERKKVEMVVELVEWDDKVEYDRLGVEEQKYAMLDIEVPLPGGPRAARPQPHHHRRGGGAQPPAQAPGPPLGEGVPGEALTARSPRRTLHAAASATRSSRCRSWRTTLPSAAPTPTGSSW